MNAEDDRRSKALYGAAHEGHADVVSVLIVNGVEVDAENKYGETALFLAAEAGPVECVNLLIIIDHLEEGDGNDFGFYDPLPNSNVNHITFFCIVRIY